MEKVLGFRIDIEGVTSEAEELAKLELQLKALKKEKLELQKLAGKGIASTEDIQKLAAYNAEIKKQENALKDLKKIVDSSGDSLTRMRNELINLKAQAANGSAELREKLTPTIKKLNDEISKAEQAQGTFSRNVGNYTSAFGKIGESMRGMVGPAALVAAAVSAAKVMFDGLKEAIMSTTFAMDAMNKVSAVSKQFFYDIAVNGNINMQNLKSASKLQEELNVLRVKDAFETLEISKLNREEQAVRELSIDQTKTHAERLEYLNKVVDLHSKQVEIQVGNLTDELNVKRKLLEQQPANEKLGLEVIALMTKINDTYAQEDQYMRRITSQRTAFMKEERDKRVEALTELFQEAQDEIEANEERIKEKAEADKKAREDELKAISDHHKAVRDMYKKKWEDLVNEEKAGNSLAADVRKLYGIKDEDLGLQSNKKIQDDAIKGAKAAADDDVRIAKEAEEQKLAYRKAALEGAQMGADAAFNSKRSRLQAEMEAELSNQALTEEQKDVVKKKYAKQQQRIDISQAIINGALAVTNLIATTPGSVLNPATWVGIALAGLTVGIQIAAIKAQKYATGGKINRGITVNTGMKDDTLILANKTETVLTQRHVAALGGSGTMRKIGVPGYAMGGYVGQQAPEIPSIGFDYEAMARLINSLEVRLDINKVTAAQNELSIINETQRL